MDRNKGIYLTKLQLMTSLIFLGAFCVSIFLTYNSLLAYDNKEIINKKRSKEISYANRIVVTVLLFLYLYISYEEYKNGSSDEVQNKILFDELIASIIAIVAGFIVLYDSFLGLSTSDVDTENPDL